MPRIYITLLGNWYVFRKEKKKTHHNTSVADPDLDSAFLGHPDPDPDP